MLSVWWCVSWANPVLLLHPQSSAWRYFSFKLIWKWNTGDLALYVSFNGSQHSHWMTPPHSRIFSIPFSWMNMPPDLRLQLFGYMCMCLSLSITIYLQRFPCGSDPFEHFQSLSWIETHACNVQSWARCDDNAWVRDAHIRRAQMFVW